jgi:succinoglycan biosynthesis transport protein ExoP
MLESVRAQTPTLSDWGVQERESSASPLSLRFLLDVVRRRGLALLICVVTMLALAGVYVYVTPKQYSATITLLIDSRLAQLSQTDGSAAVVDQAAVESQIELLRSEKVILNVIDKLGLVNDPEFGSVSARTGAKEAVSADVALRRAVAIMTANLWVTRIGRSYLVSVTYNSVDPVKAARVANEVASAYITDQIGAKIQAAKDQNAWLDAQVNEMRSRAAQTYRAVQDFKGAHDINPLRDLGVQSEIDRLAGDASRARAATIIARTTLDRSTALLASPAAMGSTIPDEATLRAFGDPEIDRLAARYAALSADPAPADSGHADQASNGVQRSAVARDLWTRITQIAAAQRSEWQAASARQQGVDGALADMRLRDTRGRLVQERLRELETEAATARSLYESYLNQRTHAAQQQPVPASDARVISAATVPLYPGTPKKRLILPLAGVAGVILGLLAAFTLEAMDDVIRTRDRVEQITGLPCIGIVPRMRRKGGGGREMSSLDSLWDGFPRLGASDPRGKASDMLRNLQLSVYGGPRPGAAVLGMTSAVPGEGKTTIALNLAIAASNAGRRVLLVDCNLRNPTLSRAALPDGSAVAPAFGQQNAIHVQSGFDLLPASNEGTIAGAELPDAGLLETILAEARSRYDLVIVDLPSILPLSELRSVVRHLDTVVLVARWGSTTGQQMERALKRLSDPDRLIGVVLNRVSVRSMRRFEGSSHRAYADRA